MGKKNGCFALFAKAKLARWSVKLNITITDIKPGLVDTAMAKGDGLFWVMPLDKASRQIYTALKNKVETIYVTKRWKWIACMLKIMPQAIYYKI